jgi:5-oxopent-3-ene-1,2,5-tricarboxylate decarboxylase / 2-hydroxyhepta-2,4-diene-1,7-dioate isomerase
VEVQTNVVAIAGRFEKIPTATVFDVLAGRGLGAQSCLAPGIRQLTGAGRRAGPAFTVRWVRDPRPAVEWSPPGLRRLSDYFAPIKAGAIVVVDGAHDRTNAHWGDMLSLMAALSGARAVVVDGGVRDTEAIAEIDGFAAYARYTSPVEAIPRLRIHDVDVPVLLRGALQSVVCVRPGDWIVADAEAVIVVPIEHLEDVLVQAEEFEVIEASMRAELRGGASIDDVFRRYRRA